MAELICSNGESLPLQSVSAEINIVDVLARVNLSQLFLNEGHGEVDLEATYQFPVPPGSAVCAFHAVLDNGTTIVGIIKEKDEAQKEYDAAIASGKQAVLAVQDRTDIFSISVGNIPPKSKIVVNLGYVIELNDDGDADQVRFVLPTTIAPKYSSQSGMETVIGHGTAAIDYKLKVTTSIQMNETIRTISSPSHQIEVQIGTIEPDSLNSFEPKHAYLTLAAESFLDRDLVIIIKAAGLDAPRCTSESYQAVEYPSAPSVFKPLSASDTPPQTTALALTLVPRFNLPPIPSQEYILVADRSGSMEGFKNDTMKAALQLLLRSLPPTRSYLQIVSFGSDYSMLFPGKSVLYDEESLHTASAHVDSMEADMGGTQIREALTGGAFTPRRKDIPTSVFILTDGEVWDLEDVLSSVRTATQISAGEGALRVFALGIGNAVDAALVSGIAREGNGIAQFVAEGERMESKLIKLLRSAKSPSVRDVMVEWTADEPLSTIADDFLVIPPLDTEKVVSQLYNPDHKDEPIPTNNFESSREPIVLPPFARIQQSPAAIPHIYSGSRVIVYGVLSDSISPTKVTIRAKTDAGDKLELVVPVMPVVSTNLGKVKTGSTGIPLIHTLSARKLLADLEEGKDASDTPAVIRAKMVRLGIMYNLASKYTSFFAAESDTFETATKDKRQKKHILIPTRLDRGGGQEVLIDQTESFALPSPAPPVPSADKRRARFGSLMPKFFFKSGLQAQAPVLASKPSLPSVPIYSLAPVAKEGYSCQAAPSALLDFTDRQIVNADREIVNADEEKVKEEEEDRALIIDALPESKEERRAKLVRFQAFNGSFSSSSVVCMLLGLKTFSPPHGVADTVWATSIALAWLQRECADEKDEWEVIAAKAEAFVHGSVNGEVLLSLQSAAAAAVALV